LHIPAHGRVALLRRRVRELFVPIELLMVLSLLAFVPWVAALAASRSLQNIMQTEVDTAADGVWTAVGTIITRKGTERRQPRTPGEWAAVRNAAVKLVDAAKSLMVDGRPLAIGDFSAEAQGALDSAQIQQLIAAKRPAFDAFAAALRDAGTQAIAASDAKDAAALIRVGGSIEEVCEACHSTFWYPHQVIPAFPRDHDPHRPIIEIGFIPRSGP